MLHSLDLYGFTHDRRNVLQILLVLERNEDALDPTAVSRQNLLLEAADRQDATAQSNFSGHGSVVTDRDLGQGRNQRGSHGDPGRRTILRGRPFRNVDMHLDLLVEVSVK